MLWKKASPARTISSSKRNSGDRYRVNITRLDLIREDAESQRARELSGLVLSFSVNQNTGKFRDFGNPAAVGFSFEFDRERHRNQGEYATEHRAEPRQRNLPHRVCVVSRVSGRISVLAGSASRVHPTYHGISGECRAKRGARPLQAEVGLRVLAECADVEGRSRVGVRVSARTTTH